MLRLAGHDVETVFQEHLSGARDEIIFEACVRESRCLLTLDLDFADVTRYPPHTSAGLAVLRLPRGATLRTLEQFVRSLVLMLQTETPQGGSGSSKLGGSEFMRTQRPTPARRATPKCRRPAVSQRADRHRKLSRECSVPGFNSW